MIFILFLFLQGFWETTAWKVSKYEIISGPYFPVIRLKNNDNPLDTSSQIFIGHLRLFLSPQNFCWIYTQTCLSTIVGENFQNYDV